MFYVICLQVSLATLSWYSFYKTATTKNHFEVWDIALCLSKSLSLFSMATYKGQFS